MKHDFKVGDEVVVCRQGWKSSMRETLGRVEAVSPHKVYVRYMTTSVHDIVSEFRSKSQQWMRYGSWGFENDVTMRRGTQTELDKLRANEQHIVAEYEKKQAEKKRQEQDPLCILRREVRGIIEHDDAAFERLTVEQLTAIQKMLKPEENRP